MIAHIQTINEFHHIVSIYILNRFRVTSRKSTTFLLAGETVCAEDGAEIFLHHFNFPGGGVALTTPSPLSR